MFFNLSSKGTWQLKCQRTSICSLLGLPNLSFKPILICLLKAISRWMSHLIIIKEKYSLHYFSRDETSLTATPGPNSPNDYLQYGVSHADDIYYLFKVSPGWGYLVNIPLSLPSEEFWNFENVKMTKANKFSWYIAAF